jgi:hypothetical protein
MATAQRFDRFLRNLEPDTVDLRDARTKSREIGKKLHGHYYVSEFTGSTIRVIGSYGKGTAVRPVRDVDIMFVMPSREFPRWDAYKGNGQSALLQEIRRVLNTRYPRTDISGDGQVVVVPFQSGHSVEVLPAWELTNGKYRTPNTHNGGSWHDADHDAEKEFVEKSDNASNGNARHLIKMLKVWQEHCSVPIKSLALELRSVEFVKTWTHRGHGTTYYDWMVRDSFAELVQKVGATHVVPGTNDRFSYGTAWESRARTALLRAQNACAYELQNSHHRALEEWAKIFGSQFYR